MVINIIIYIYIYIYIYIINIILTNRQSIVGDCWLLLSGLKMVKIVKIRYPCLSSWSASPHPRGCTESQISQWLWWLLANNKDVLNFLHIPFRSIWSNLRSRMLWKKRLQKLRSFSQHWASSVIFCARRMMGLQRLYGAFTLVPCDFTRINKLQLAKHAHPKWYLSASAASTLLSVYAQPVKWIHRFNSTWFVFYLSTNVSNDSINTVSTCQHWGPNGSGCSRCHSVVELSVIPEVAGTFTPNNQK